MKDELWKWVQSESQIESMMKLNFTTKVTRHGTNQVYWCEKLFLGNQVIKTSKK